MQRRHEKINNPKERKAAEAAYGAARGCQRLKAVAASNSRNQRAEKRQLWKHCNPGEDIPGDSGVNKWIAGHKGGVIGARAAAALALKRK